MKKLLGGILIAAGILVAGASGLCTATFLIWFFVDVIRSGWNSSEPENMGVLLTILFFGCAPFLTGIGLIFAGRVLVRSARREEG